MITESEAIEDIEKALELGVPDGLKKETLILANMALKKQIPTNPIRKSWELPRCPSCGAALGEWLGDGYTKDWESKTVCDCGQQIDWS